MPQVTDNKINWKALEEMRSGFLGAGSQAMGNYWHSKEALSDYDRTFAQRIGWKWQAVLSELRQRQWTPPVGATVLDWGCGTGIAARSWLDFWPEISPREVLLWDRSELALQFAKEKIADTHPALPCRTWDQSAPTGPFVLLISHVLNEISSEQAGQLLQLLVQAEAVVWVEPGTFDVSRRLIAVREELRTSLRVVAPCTHQSSCGLRSAENHHNWCHFFAPTPSAAHQDGFWNEFSKQLDIDLRSLPVSFLVLEKPTRALPADPLRGQARMIGRERAYKGFAKVLACQNEVVGERALLKRHAKDVLRSLKKQTFLQTLPSESESH